MNPNSTIMPAEEGGEHSESAYAIISRLISDRTFLPGAPLRETALAEMIGMSRTPVREALNWLAAEGVVELQRAKGARLGKLTHKDINAIFDLRSVLEPFVAGRAALNATAEDIDSLESLLSQMISVTKGYDDFRDRSELGKLNTAFHASLVRISGPQGLDRILRTATREPLLNQYSQHLDQSSAQRLNHQHRDILDAVTYRNRDWAEAAMRSHIEFARAIYVKG